MDAEQAIFGLILTNPKNFDDCSLKSYHFAWPEHQKLFDTISKQIEAGEPINPSYLVKKYENDAEFMAIGQDYLVDLYSNCPFLNGIKEYEKEIMRQYIRRETMDVIHAVKNAVEESTIEDPSLLLNRIDGILAGFDKTESRSHHMSESIKMASKWIEDARSGTAVMYKTGFTDLDNKIGGLKPGGLYVLAGRAGMGKTVAALNIAEHVAQTRPVLFFSLEMPSEELSMRLIAGRTSIPVMTQMVGKTTDYDMSRIKGAGETLSKINITIDATAGIDVDYIFSCSRKFARKNKNGLVVIDHLGLIRGNPKLQKVHQIEEITTKLKTLAKTIHSPVLLLCQLSRAVDQRDDKKPVLSDLRDSGSIEQDADVVIFTYRPEYYEKNKKIVKKPNMSDEKFRIEQEAFENYLESIKGQAFFYIEKNRQGVSGTVELKFDGVRQKFINL